MSKPNALVDVSEGTTVSNNSPQSPTGRALLEPITLDFDPMSFEFKEDSPLTSPSDSNREIGDMLSPSQNADVVEFFDPFCPVKEESPTDYYPNVMLGQTPLEEPLIGNLSEPQQFSPLEEPLVGGLSEQQLLDGPLIDNLSEPQQFASGFSNYEQHRDLDEPCQDSSVLNESFQNNCVGNDSSQNDYFGNDQSKNYQDLHESNENVQDLHELNPNDEDRHELSQNDQDLDELSQNDQDLDELSQNDQALDELCPNNMPQILTDIGDEDGLDAVHDKPNELSDFCTNSELTVASSKSETSGDIELLTELEQTHSEETCVSPVSEQVFDDNKHDISSLHEQCQISEDDISRKGRTNSSSSSHSSRSDRSEKKSSYKIESNHKEETKISSNITSPKKESMKKEVITKKSAVLKTETNGYSSHNGIDNTVSLKNSKNTEKTLHEEHLDSLASVTDLMSTYVSLTAQESQPLSTKEIISTGIDIKSLKSNYAQHGESTRGISPEREIISTGIDVRALKTSFTKSSDDSQQNLFQEEVKSSVDRVKVQRTFSQSGQDELCLCKVCNKHVYQMEKMKAEKNIFHKNCFRCKECNKLLNVDSYSSNEGDIYCKPHFRQLFQPKARFDGEDAAPNETQSDEGKQRRNEMIIRENIPAELPPDVVRGPTVF